VVVGDLIRIFSRRAISYKIFLSTFLIANSIIIIVKVIIGNFLCLHKRHKITYNLHCRICFSTPAKGVSGYDRLGTCNLLNPEAPPINFPNIVLP